MFLLCAIVLTGTCDVKAQGISIKSQTRLCVSHNDSRVIDPEKQLVLPLPLPITFARRKLKNLEPVFVRIAKVKSLDTTRVLVPIGQTLWTSGSMFDFVLTQ